MIGLDIVEALLGAPPGYPPWRVADLAQRAEILPTWLSSVVARGLPLTPEALEYLERAQRRVDALHAIGEELSAVHPVKVVKGKKIADLMPPGLLRNSGDADIVTRDEETLWRCVADLRQNHGAVPQGVNVLRTSDTLDVAVALKWAAEEPFLDKPLGADIGTCAYCGDLAGVEIRAEAVADDDLGSVFAVAEERFQRKFSRKDMLDFVVLADRLDHRLGEYLVDTLLDLAHYLSLAPELRALIHKTGQRWELPAVWLDIEDALEPLATEERAARKSGKRDVPELLYGYPLDTDAAPEPQIRIHRFSGGEIATTPIGTCLLLRDPVMTEETHQMGIEIAKQLRSRTPREW